MLVFLFLLSFFFNRRRYRQKKALFLVGLLCDIALFLWVVCVIFLSFLWDVCGTFIFFCVTFVGYSARIWPLSFQHWNPIGTAYFTPFIRKWDPVSLMLFSFHSKKYTFFSNGDPEKSFYSDLIFILKSLKNFFPPSHQNKSSKKYRSNLQKKCKK